MRRSIRLLSLLLVLCAGRAGAQEVQVPLDEAGRVQVVDRRLAQRLALWVDEYPGFQEARLFQASDSAFSLEVSYLRDGRLTRERLPRSAAEVSDLRSRVAALLESRAGLDESGGVDQAGRYLLLGQSTLAGIAFYGWALPLALGVDDASSASGLYLLTSGASFFLPFALTANRPVTFGMANLSRYGLTRGIFHGVLLHNLIRGEEEHEFRCLQDDPCFYEDNDDFERGRLGGALLMSVAEGVGGYLWARNERMSAGTANTLVAGGDLGLFWGLGAAVVAGTDHINERSSAAIALPVAAGAILGAHRLAQRRDYTWGDADVLYTGGAVGALAGVAVADLIGDVDDEKLGWGVAVLGSAAGAYLADGLVSRTDFSVGQATLNRLGALAGGLAGASLGALADDETVALTGAALGAAAGYILTYASLAPDAPVGRGERMSAAAWEVSLQPQGLLAARWVGAPAPLLSVRYRF